MLIFAASDKGGTGRSVTSANLAYHRALAGDDVCYLDFDFGSPTAAAVFDVADARQATEDRGLHAYLIGESANRPGSTSGPTPSTRCCASRRPAAAGWC